MFGKFARGGLKKPGSEPVETSENSREELRSEPEREYREPFSFKDIPGYQYYMPFLVFMPPALVGADADEATEIRHDFLQECLYTADRWHTKIEEALSTGRIDQSKCDDFHAHIRFALEEFRERPSSSFWLGLKAEQRDVYVHKLIRDYLAANQHNRPKATHLDQNAKADLDTREPTFTIPADQFFANEATQVDGSIWTTFEVTDIHIIYGPYLPFPAGEYVAAFEMTLECPFSIPTLIVTLDAVMDGIVIAQKEIDSTMLFYNKSPPKLPIRITNSTSTVEFRVKITGRPFNAKLIFTGVRLYQQD